MDPAMRIDPATSHVSSDGFAEPGDAAPAPAPDQTSPRHDRPQCMEALELANQVRSARAALKREVTSGRRKAAEVIRHCPSEAETMPIFELLAAQRRWGSARTRRFLTAWGVDENKKIGTLTERQVRMLVGALTPGRSGYQRGVPAMAYGRA
jgi:hypothetical protein